MTETTDMQRIKDLQYCLDWLDGEHIDLANALIAELGSSHPLFQRYCHCQWPIRGPRWWPGESPQSSGVV